MYAANHGSDWRAPWKIITPTGASSAQRATPEELT
jgi:hypothetical protein